MRQYPLNPNAAAEMDLIVKELLIHGVVREELNSITNSPIQGVQKSEVSGGGWRAVINFKALNQRTVANRASLINPHGTLKTLQVRSPALTWRMGFGLYPWLQSHNRKQLSLIKAKPMCGNICHRGTRMLHACFKDL